MRTKSILLFFTFFMMMSFSYAQKKDEPKSIISKGAAIKKYHNKAELDRMQKGELLVLYIERMQSLVKTMPYIAFATKPGITMSSLGIPNNKDNRKTLDSQFEASDEFLKNTVEFQRHLLPYSDTDNIVAAILFYEDIMKSLHEYAEFH